MCRASYIDPRVFDRYQGGRIIEPVLGEDAEDEAGADLPIHQRAVEEAVLDLISERARSRALDRIAA